MRLVYEIDLYYKVEVLAREQLNDSERFLLTIEGVNYIYEILLNKSTGLISYQLGPERYIDRSIPVQKDKLPDLSIVIPLYETMKNTGLETIRITGRSEKAEQVDQVDQVKQAKQVAEQKPVKKTRPKIERTKEQSTSRQTIKKPERPEYEPKKKVKEDHGQKWVDEDEFPW